MERRAPAKRKRSGNKENKITKATADNNKDIDNTVDNEIEEESLNIVAESSKTVFHRWLDEGTPQPDGTIDHELLGIKVNGENYVIGLGDAVMLKSPRDESYYGQYDMNYYGSTPIKPKGVIARVERLWEEKIIDQIMPSSHQTDAKTQKSVINFRARWFFEKNDVVALNGEFVWLHNKEITRESFLNGLSPDDLILTNQTDDNTVSSIAGPCHVLYRSPRAENLGHNLPPDTYICSHSISFGVDSEVGKILIEPYEGENDELKLPSPNSDVEPSTKRTRSGELGLSGDGSDADMLSAATMSTNDDDDIAAEEEEEDGGGGDDDDVENDNGSPTLLRGEYTKPSVGPSSEGGSTEKRDIRIGDQHQAVVTKFVPNTPVVSRNPTLVWQPGMITDEDLDNFLISAADVLTPYLQENGFSTSEPYSPQPSDKMEASMRESTTNDPPTLSTISTASSLSSIRNNLLRECNADALLQLLAQKEYDIASALAAIEASPGDYVATWSPEEKELFNSGFRRYSGSLRMITKSITPSKDFKDIIDYHYRFKIPDQFRRFQEKKREQAVRIMECIETRRYLNSIIQNEKNNIAQDTGTTKRSKDAEWSKTSINEVVGAVEERRVDAKNLLLEVESVMGKEKMIEVADAIKQLHEQPVSELKSVLIDILKDHTGLLERFLEFLPKRYR